MIISTAVALSLIIIGFLIYMLKTMKRMQKSLEYDIKEVRKVAKRNSNITLNFEQAYEMIIINEENQSIVCTTRDIFLPNVPSIGEMMSFLTPDLGYMNGVVTNVNHYKRSGESTLIFIHIKDFKENKLPINLEEVEQFNKRFQKKRNDN